MLKNIIIANWKMNPKSQREALALFEAIRKYPQMGLTGLLDLLYLKLLIPLPSFASANDGSFLLA